MTRGVDGDGKWRAVTQHGVSGNGKDGSGASVPGGSLYAEPSPPPAPRYAPERPEPEGMTLRDYLAVMWRRKWIIALVVLVATASAYWFSARQPEVYEAEATIIYKQQLDLSNPLGTTGVSNVNLDREFASINGLLQGPNLRQRIATALEKDASLAEPLSYEVSAAPEEEGSTTTTSPTNVVVFTASSGSAVLSAAVADAAAQSYVDWNAEFQRRQISEAIPALEAQLKRYDTEQARLSTDYLLLKQRLQDLQILRATTSGNYQLLAPAAVPEEPVEPKPLRSAILGFGVGLFAGIGLAFLLEQFDTRVRQTDEVAAILRQPILGRVPRISRKLLGESALVTMHQPDGLVAEAFRMVRTNLDFMAVDAEVRSIVVTSCIQGEGKSVTVANLAVSMALAGKKIVVVDADLRRPRQHTYFGIQNERGVSTVAAGKDGLLDALVRVNVEQPANGDASGEFSEWAAGTDAQSRLYVLPSGPLPPNPGEIVASRRFAAILDELRDEADLLLVDSPALLAVGDASVVASRVDGLVFLVDLKQVKRPQLLTAADQLFRLPARMLGTIVRLDAARGTAYYYSPHDYYRYTYATDDTRGKKERRRTGVGRSEDQQRV